MLSALLYKHAESMLFICLQKYSIVFVQTIFPQQFAKSWQQAYRSAVKTSKGHFTTLG